MLHLVTEQTVVLFFLALVLWAGCSDAISFKIPDAASLALASLYPVHVLVSPVFVDWPWALAVSAAIFTLGFLLFVQGWIGGGDVKLLSVAALWAGPKLVLSLLVVTSLAGGVLGVLVLGRHWFVHGRGILFGTERSGVVATPVRLPYGVAIAAGAGLVGLRLLSG